MKQLAKISGLFIVMSLMISCSAKLTDETTFALHYYDAEIVIGGQSVVLSPSYVGEKPTDFKIDNITRNGMIEYLKDAKFKICIEKNKPDAIAALKEACAGKEYIEIVELKAIYPQGAKQVMLYNATGRVSIAGKRFPYFHAIIINVSSLAKVAEYLNTGMPLVERIVTVDGPAVANPQNLIAPIGTRISHLLETTGLKAAPGKVVVGGPMNGNAVCSADDPIVKVSNSILVFDERYKAPPFGALFSVKLELVTLKELTFGK